MTVLTLIARLNPTIHLSTVKSTPAAFKAS
jgi:hypothetical protein